MDPNLIHIRQVIASDFETVYLFINALEHTTFDKNTQQDIFLKNLSNSEHVFLLAEVNQTPVGYLSCMVQLLIHHGGPVGEIQEMYVEPDYRSQGVGKALIDRLKSIAKQKNWLQLEVTSGLQRGKAHDFYLREGFADSHKKFTLGL
ncbi:MAG: GNAT family N-acetyltransferase [Flavobacterium sp.]